MADAATAVAALATRDKIILMLVAAVVGTGSGVGSSRLDNWTTQQQVTRNTTVLEERKPIFDAAGDAITRIDRRLTWVEASLGHIYKELTGKSLPTPPHPPR